MVDPELVQDKLVRIAIIGGGQRGKVNCFLHFGVSLTVMAVVFRRTDAALLFAPINAKWSL